MEIHRDLEQERDLKEMEEEKKGEVANLVKTINQHIEQRKLLETELQFVKYENQRLKDQIEQLVQALERR